MLAIDLPKSEHVGFASNALSLAILLDETVAATPGPFLYFDRALGAERSCRLLFQRPVEPFTATAPFPEPYNSHAAAQEFFLPSFMVQVRFFPNDPPTRDAKRGWEVRRANYEGFIFVIVWAAWV